jgi:hypothetical protein
MTGKSLRRQVLDRGSSKVNPPVANV